MKQNVLKKPKIVKKVYALLLCIVIVFSCIPVMAKEPAATSSSVAKSVLLDRKTISYTAILSEIPACDDGMFYLFEMQPFEYTVSATTPIVAQAAASLNPTFTVANTKNSLYTKLGLAVKSGGQYILIANPQYITNPELLVVYTRDRKSRPLHSVQGHDFNNYTLLHKMYGGVPRGTTTVQLMNDGYNQLITNPNSRRSVRYSDSHPVTPQYYMLNASETDSIAELVDEIEECAYISAAENFIIGNEVNVRAWNYMVWTDWDNYIREYAQAFRVAYNAIKSTNANARVFVCIDQNWDRNRSTSHSEYYEYIDGKDFLTKFNALISSEGNIDWGVAQHPYPVPLTYAKFWDMSGCPDGAYMQTQVSTGKMLTFQNLSLLTDYLQTPEMLSPTGAVRHVILSEIGITNAQGSDVQAAALYASYMAAKRNPYIEEIIYLFAYNEAQVDTYLSDQSQLVFDSFGTPNEETYDVWAKALIGISDWSQVLK